MGAEDPGVRGRGQAMNSDGGLVLESRRRELMVYDHVLFGEEEEKSPLRVGARPSCGGSWESDKGLESFPEGKRVGEPTKDKGVVDGGLGDLGTSDKSLMRIP